MTTEVHQIEGLGQLGDARVQDVVADTCRTIQRALPDVELWVFPNAEHRGAVVEVYTDSADADAVLDLVIARHVDLLVEEDIDIGVIHLSRAWLRPVTC